MRANIKTQTQAGFVSLLTVIMFMILTSIVTISFVGITLNEQRQTLNDDLAKGAYDAAQAGIEDAKRAIQYCQSSPGACPSGELYRQTCGGFYMSPSINGPLDLTVANQSVAVGDASANQRYTCVTISNEVKEYWGELDPGSASAQTTFLPLRSKDPFNRVKISWAQKTTSSNFDLPGSGEVSDINPTQTGTGSNAWESDWPAMMRAMLVEHPSNTNNISGSVTSQSSFLVPTDGAGDTSFSRAGAGLQPRALVDCDTINAEYICEATITGLTPSTSWYLQLAPYYQTTAFKVELFDGSVRRSMQDVGYVVDSTGAVGDVFRRVQVLLGPDDLVSPSAAIQSGERLCKNFWVTGMLNNVLFDEDCNPSGTLPASPPGGGVPGADAAFGGYCSIHVCAPSNQPSNPNRPLSFTREIYNTSQNANADVAGCTWLISDGTTIQNQHCNYGDNFEHTFPTTPPPTRTDYTVDLTIRLRSGVQATYREYFRMPY